MALKKSLILKRPQRGRLEGRRRRRSALCRLPCFRKNCSSSQVGISGEQSSRETAKAPQAATTITIDMTTALVAASPTAEELLPH